MKKLISVSFLFVFALLLTNNSSAQIRKIPSDVTQALKEKYPNADNVSWKDKLTVFEAVFELNNEKYAVRFNDKGEWKSTEKEIEESNLPSDVKDGFEKSKYADWELKNVYLIELPSDAIQYRILVGRSDIQKKNLLFNSGGRLMKDNITL